MAALSKHLHYTCYELGHTWTPFCTQATFDVASAAYLESFKIYFVVYLVTSLLRGRGKNLFSKKFFLEILRSTLFLGTNAGAFIGAFCLWRHALQHFNHLTAIFVPAFIGSFIAIILERKPRRGLLALYMTNVAIETAFRMAVARNIVTPLKHGEVLLFSCTSAVALFLYRRPNGLSPAITSGLKFLIGQSELPPSVASSSETVSPHTLNRSPKSSSVSFLPSQIQLLLRLLRRGSKHTLCRHQNSCISSTVEASARAFALGYLIQSAVKFATALPVMFSRPRQLLRAFANRDSLNFGAFLGSFVGIFKGSSCLLKWLFNRDSEVHGLLAGFLAGFSMMFYKSPTIALYISCKMVEILYFKGIEAGKLPLIKNAEVFIYSVATALVFHAAVFEVHNLRPSYWKFLMRLTRGRFAQMNRHLLDVYGTQATKILDYWPNYDPKYSSLTRS